MARGLKGMMAVVVGMSAMGRVGAAEDPAAPPAEVSPAEPGISSSAPAEEGKVAYTFQDDASLNEFQELWRQRQGLMLRLSVLQAYWDEEQAALAELDQQLASKYQLDLTKNYIYDNERGAIVEQEPPQPPAPPASPEAPPVSPPPPAEPPPTPP